LGVNVLYLRKYFPHYCDFSALLSDSAPGALFPPFPPRYSSVRHRIPLSLQRKPKLGCAKPSTGAACGQRAAGWT